MNQKSEEGLFEVLEKILKNATEPLDAVELYEKYPEIRERASSPNRVSDYLGNMWRAPKNLLLRVPAPGGLDRKTRWLYAWKGKQIKKPDLKDVKAMAFDPQVHTLLHKPNIHIEDDGHLVTISLPGFTITIRHNED